MKIRIITDIHSNINALNVVLNKFDKIKIDKIICCGDVIGIGPNPEETIQALIKRKYILSIIQVMKTEYIKNILRRLQLNRMKKCLVKFNEGIKEIERLRFTFYKGILKIFYGKE